MLIASMSGTYEEAMANATRNWRWAFARRVLRMVMLAGYDRPVGTLDTIRDWGGKKRYYVEVLSVKKNIEGVRIAALIFCEGWWGKLRKGRGEGWQDEGEG